jgi:nucleoside-diphosphate-sugar epimerase
MTPERPNASPILVTGAAGAVGSIGRNLTEMLLAKGHKVRPSKVTSLQPVFLFIFKQMGFMAFRRFCAHSPDLKETCTGMIFENLSIANVAAQRVHRAVPGLIGHLEDRGPACGGAGQESRS